MLKIIGICLLVAACAAGIGHFENEREECPTCHKGMHPMQGFPSILECPCGFQVDISR